MSATSRGFRPIGDTDDIVGTARAHATTPRSSVLHGLVATEDRIAGTIARLTLGLIMLPHAAQKMFGWFGGFGFTATSNAMTSQLGIPGALVALAIFAELACSLMLIVGAFTRVAAVGIFAVMLGAVVVVHASVGFFMNWTGAQAGEGFEYHLLAMGLCLVSFVIGGGKVSVDRALTLRRPAEGGSVPAPITRD